MQIRLTVAINPLVYLSKTDACFLFSVFSESDDFRWSAVPRTLSQCMWVEEGGGRRGGGEKHKLGRSIGISL